MKSVIQKTIEATQLQFTNIVANNSATVLLVRHVGHVIFLSIIGRGGGGVVG